MINMPHRSHVTTRENLQEEEACSSLKLAKATLYTLDILGLENYQQVYLAHLDYLLICFQLARTTYLKHNPQEEMSSNNEIKVAGEGTDKLPPIFKSWNQLYIFVLALHIVLILAFYLMTISYS